MDTPDTFWSLFFGYAVIWALIVFFIYRLQRAQRELSQRLTQLESRQNLASDNN